MSTLTFRIKMAFGADLTVNSAAWFYTDLSSRSLGSVSVQFGSSDEASSTTPGEVKLRLRNTDGWLTPHNPASQYFPYVRRQTPVSVEVNPGTGYVQLFQGFIDEITPTWPAGNSQYSEVQIVASGSLRRLNQGSPTLQSAIYRSNIAAGPIVYAPMEESSGATMITATGRISPQNAIFAGTVAFAGDDTLGGSKPTVVLNGTSYIGVQSGGWNYSGNWQVDWFYKFPNVAPAAETIVMRAYTNSPNATLVDAVFGGTTWGIRTYTATGTATGSTIFGFPAGIATGWWHWRIMAHDAGGGQADYQVVVNPVDSTLSGAFAALSLAVTTAGDLTACGVRPTTTAMDGVAMAHLAFFDRWNFSAVDASADGYAGEVATTRLARLARESHIEMTVTGTSTTAMGPQKPNTVMSLLRDCENADGGILSDGFTAGLSYLSHSARYNQSATLVLDVDRQQVKLPFLPTEDDQRVTNDVTSSRTGGASIEIFDQAHIDGNSRYQSSAEVNVEKDAQLIDDAGWRVHLGSVDEMRVPGLSLQLIDRPELWAGALALRPGHRITVDNLLDQYPPGTLALAVEGITATLSAESWKLDINCSPASPWDVGVMDTNWLDCGRSVLGTAIPVGLAGSSTTIDVLVSDGCNWTHADGDVPITIGGENMTLTAVGATTTPTPALVAVGTKAEGNAAPVSVPLPAGGTAAGNLLLLLASVRDTNAVETDMYITVAPGWERIFDGVNMSLFAKVHSGSEVAPTLNYIAGIAGDTIIAQMASFSGKWGDPKSQLVAAVQQVNGSDQNIGYPAVRIPLSGTLVLWLGWKADDWTSVAPVVTEIAEATSTLGNDAGIVWDYDVAVSATSLAGGSFVVTGGTSQISRGAAVGFRNVYQTLTVTRGVNTRAHPIGEEVHVTRPLLASKA